MNNQTMYIFHGMETASYQYGDSHAGVKIILTLNVWEPV